jgi:crotonobetainyl-CoA:carnitine CoA-transferase CaiB-like acyl-CoA transferase
MSLEGKMLALEGLRILDLTRAGPGPFCTWILGDLGAEVIKIEAPLALGARQAGILNITIDKSKDRDKTIAHRTTNRNKKSICLNLKSDEGKDIFYRLIEKTDAVVEGFRPGVTKRLGIDFESISKVNPKVIYCSITGYGQSGPYRDLVGHDVNYIAMGGALNLIGKKGEKPVIPLNLLGDFGGAGMNAVVGILSAIIARGRTGKGQFVDISLLDSVISLIADNTNAYFQNGVVPERGTLAFSGAYPYYNVYQTKDGKFISIGCVEPAFWENLCRAINKEEFIPYCFAHEHTFQSPQGEKWDEIMSSLEQIFLTKTRDEWFDILRQYDVPVGKVYSIDESFSDPHVLHRRMVEEIEHSSLGTIKQIGIAVKLSDTAGKVRSLPPKLGEHTEEILKNLGYSEDRISKMRASGTIG